MPRLREPACVTASLSLKGSRGRSGRRREIRTSGSDDSGKITPEALATPSAETLPPIGDASDTLRNHLHTVDDAGQPGRWSGLDPDGRRAGNTLGAALIFCVIVFQSSADPWCGPSKMLAKFAIFLTALGALADCAGQPVTTAQPPPETEQVKIPRVDGKAAQAPPVKEDAPCVDRFSEGACKQRRGCSWVNEYKRTDGTWASAYCWGGKAGHK